MENDKSSYIDWNILESPYHEAAKIITGRYEPPEKKVYCTSSHEYTKRKDGTWKCRHCETELEQNKKH